MIKLNLLINCLSRRVWRVNQNPYIEEEQTTQLPSEKKRTKNRRTSNDLQNITHKTKDRETRTLLKTSGERMCSGRNLEPTCTLIVDGQIMCMFYTNVNNIAVKLRWFSVIGGGKQSTQRKAYTCCKSLTNFLT